MEQFANLAQTTLNGAITKGATSLVVTSAAKFPTEPNFRVLVDAELMLVTKVEGTTFTVERGAEGSEAAEHSNGAAVTSVLTRGALIAYAEYIGNKSDDTTLGGGSPSTTLYPTQHAVNAAIAAAVQGLSLKQSVVLATTAALPTAVYNNGAEGVGATLTGVSVGALSLDGSAVVVGKRVLVKNQATEFQNGIYTVTAAGGIAAVYVLTRTTDMNEGKEFPGAFTFVESGAENENSGWALAGTAITVGTTAVKWIQFSGAGEIKAGTGIEKSGNTLNAVPEETRAKGVEATKADLVEGKLKESELPSSVVSSSLKALGEVTGATKLNFAAGTFQTATLKGATTFSVENAPGRPAILELLVEQNGTGGFAWSIEGITWIGAEPTFETTAHKQYLVQLLLLEGKVYGFAGLPGPAGANGHTILSGAGSPGAGEGNVGDLFVKVEASTPVAIWGPKTSEGWGTEHKLKGETGSTGATGATGSTGAPGGDLYLPKFLLPKSVFTYKEPGAGTNENRAVIAESIPRWLVGGTSLELTSGTPVGAAIAVQPGKIIHGVGVGVITTEGTAANRTHLWLEITNSAGKVLARTADFISSAKTELPSVTLRAFLLESTLEAPEEQLYIVLCEVMSSTAAIKIAFRELSEGFLGEVEPYLGVTGPASQTTSTAVGSTMTLTKSIKIPYLIALG